MIIIGLGNPGTEYEGTRHNTGRETVMKFAKKMEFPDFVFDKKSNALITNRKVKKTKVMIALPETFMNKSGAAVGKLVKGAKAAKQLIVVHDDLDIPLGHAKMSWNKSAGGHKGVDSVIRAVGTQEFFRIRIGLTPATAKGVLKKPDQDTLIDNFIVAEWKPKEEEELKKIVKKVINCLELAVSDSPERAMSEYNAEFNK